MNAGTEVAFDRLSWFDVILIVGGWGGKGWGIKVKFQIGLAL